MVVVQVLGIMALLMSLGSCKDNKFNSGGGGGAGPQPSPYQTDGQALPQPLPQTPTPMPSGGVVEDSGSDILGTPVDKVGINFEDAKKPEFIDFDDAVLCFAGKFKINNTTITSAKEQTIAAVTYSDSACQHRLDIVVTHPDGSKQNYSVNTKFKVNETISMTFKMRSTLVVSSTVTGARNGYCTSDAARLGATLLMSNAADTQIKLNGCNNPP